MRSVLLVILLATGCYASHPEPPRECPNDLPYLFRADDPFPRGRMHACEACALTEEICGRRLPCTLTGACDYAELVERWERLDCDLEDPCVRPDPDLYWRPEGD